MTTVRELITKWGFDVDDSPLKRLDKQIDATKATLKTLSFAFAGVSAGVGLLLREAGRFEQTSIAFETLLGSAEKAQNFLAELAEFAARTPFDLPGVEASARQLLAVGFATEEVLPNLKALGDLAAGLSVPLDRLVLNFGQVRAQGKLTGRELRDFTVAGIPLADELAKMLGKSTAEIQDMVSAGKIGFKDVERAFTAMTSGSGRFADLMDKQSRSFFGILSNIKDVIIRLARDIGGVLLPEAKELARGFLEWVEANKELIKTRAVEFMKVMVEFLSRMVRIGIKSLKFVNNLAEAFGGLEKVLMAVVIAVSTFLSLQLLSTLGTATIAVGSLARAVLALAMGYKTAGNAAFLAQLKMVALPIAVGAAVVALVLLVEDFIGFMQGKKSFIGQIGDALSDFFKSGPLGKLLEFMNNILNPFVLLLNVIEKLQAAFANFSDGKVLQGVKNLFEATPIGNLVNKTAEFFGYGDNPAIAATQGKPGGPSATAPAQGQVNSFSTNVSVNASGLTVDQASDAVSEGVRKANERMMRESMRTLAPAVAE